MEKKAVKWSKKKQLSKEDKSHKRNSASNNQGIRAISSYFYDSGVQANLCTPRLILRAPATAQGFWADVEETT